VAIRIYKPFLVQCMAVLLFNAAASQTLSYESVRLDDSGQLHIKPANGKEAMAPRLPHQSRFGAPAISPDHISVGWLAEFEDNSSPSPIDPDAFTLVVCRNGRIFRLVSGGPIVWDWKFERGGRAVAYSTGSRHGGANECLLADIKSGKVLEKWPTPTRGRLPLWAEQLRR
jgi:hypothetical protein